ncbi:hypothetical protein PC118_g24698 [Phytophthora cactorum]|uniref:Crinkler effector protein N-terminal domain-containing protein n=1 Tax=Phytophthora cactorum TaxID=29920 RepID=A0A8T1A7X2_9STRA|nr:hypothetical protein PC111_g24385 [Phytophthora cactorum]KAG2787948.1 hypothetical protein PC112_g24516 [Phytophthora cactorum]KAG2870276.1 hypothetical protein PC114_g27456 [Phytophthora cactorum]KAG2872865.1 hypothetical protein PC115_g24506 [Phytophthora cactorum]KAG2876200.1 hypothetical protein PC117_g27289 [Phytophthora cactorum]
MVQLFCAIVGVAGSAFEVDIDEAASVSALKEVIWGKIKEKFIHDDKFRSVVASDLKLSLAKKGGAWLRDDDSLDAMLRSGTVDTSCMKMRASWKLNKPSLFGPGVSLGEDVVHVLVVVPNDAGVGVGQDVERDSMSVPVAVPMGPDVDPSSCDDLLAFLESEMTNKEATGRGDYDRSEVLLRYHRA